MFYDYQRLMYKSRLWLVVLLLLAFLPARSVIAADSPEEIKVDWQKARACVKDNRFDANRINTQVSQ